MRAARSCGTLIWTSVSRSARPMAPPEPLLPAPGAEGTPERGVAQQRDHGHVTLVRSRHRSQHRRRLPAGAQCEQHVAGLAERTHLSGKAIGVRSTGAVGLRVGGVAGQRDGTELGPLAFEAAHELRGELGRQQARHAGAASQHLAAAGHAGQDGLHRLRDGFAEDRSGLVFEVGTIDEVLLNTLLKHEAG